MFGSRTEDGSTILAENDMLKNHKSHTYATLGFQYTYGRRVNKCATGHL